jgi:hypothetical protein
MGRVFCVAFLQNVCERLAKSYLLFSLFGVEKRGRKKLLDGKGEV